jgi:hypothetical protein
MSPGDGTSAFGPGAVLGDRYRVESRIASGGMATVWLAHDEELGRKVAIKVLSDVLAEDPTYAERFRREARVAARVSNQNLVRVFDYSARSERPYIVMEYVEGGTLADRVAAGDAEELDCDRLARELLGALAAIHAAGVIHRDVKPSNVLLDPDGRARLTDFGIAQPEDATELTQTGQVLGTLKYMAPEVLTGNPATERSDLYALGVVLKESLVGREVPRLEALMDRLTATDPHERPGSATQALTLLETYEQRATTATAPAESAPGTGSKVIEISAIRVVVALVALAIIGGIVAIALAGGGSDRSPSAGGRDEQPARETTTATQTSTEIATTPDVETSATDETVEPAPSANEKPPKEEKPPEDEKAPKPPKSPKGPKTIPPGQAKKSADG